MSAKLLIPITVLVAACGTDVSGPSASLFSCLLDSPALLEPGAVVQVSGRGNQGLCLAAGGEAPAEFIYIPFFAATSPDDGSLELDVDLSGAGFRMVAGPPNPSVRPALRGWSGSLAHGGAQPIRGLDDDGGFHHALRTREVRELGPLMRPGSMGLASSELWSAADVPEPGDLLTFNVAISCTEEDLRTGRVEHVSERAIVVADVANPEGLTAEDYRHFAVTFDTLVDPVSVQHFGEPTDIDGNERSILFFTRAVNELTPASSETFTAGFFWSGDLFPETDTDRAQACPAANQAEMFYLLAADPAGEAGREFAVDFVRRAAVGLIAHEYQHLINAARRLWVNNAREFEKPWLNEGLSHAAEELMFYAVTGLQPGGNLDFETITASDARRDAFNTYMGGNFGNYARYLARPDTASLMGVDQLPTRGASWNFVRYAADRSGRADDAFFMDLVNAGNAGLANLEDVLGADPLAWMLDWTVSVYADDAVPVEDRYTQPSWDFRDLYPNSTLGSFPLDVISLPAADVHAISLLPGGAAFPRFGLDAGAFGVVLVEAGGDAPPAALRGSFLRTR